MQCGSPADAARVLEEVCRSDWYPVYAYVRRYGLGVQDAEDVTQDFFQNLVAHDSLQVTSEEKGRLRSFILAVLKRSHSKHLQRDYDSRPRCGKDARHNREDGASADSRDAQALRQADRRSDCSDCQRSFRGEGGVGAPDDGGGAVPQCC